MKLTIISDFREGASVQGFFLCREKMQRNTRNGDLYLDLRLQDASGRITGRLWENVDHYRDLFEQGDPVAVKGVVEKYQGHLQLNCSQIARATVERYGRYGYSETLLVPQIDEDVKELWERLGKHITTIRNRALKRILRHIFKGHKETLLQLPGSLDYHHPLRGGWLLHTVTMADAAAGIAEVYPVLDRDLLLAGVLLHDIGKVRGTTPALEPEYTPQGHLIGHAVLGRDVLLEAIAQAGDFPEKLALRLEHLIIAHQGEAARGAPRPPKSPEALVLHYLDRLDGQLDLMLRSLAEDESDSDFTDSRNPFRTPLWKTHG